MREEEVKARDRCREVEKVLTMTSEHLARLRRSVPDESMHNSAQQLTCIFVLGLPFPRPGQWIRNKLPVHSTYTTDEGIEARSVEEHLPHSNPTQILVLKRIYYARDSATQLGTGQVHQEALRIVREMMHPDDDILRGESYMERERQNDAAEWSVYKRAAQVSKEIRRIVPPRSLGDDMDEKLLHYLSLSLPSLLEGVSKQQQEQKPPLKHQLGPKSKEVVEKSVELALQQRLDTWADSYLHLQRKLGTAQVPYSATWIAIKHNRIHKFKNSYQALHSKMLEISPPAQQSGTREAMLPRDVARELLGEYEALERDLFVALSHCRAWVLDGEEARMQAEDGVALAQAAIDKLRGLDGGASWLARLTEHAGRVERAHNLWKTASKELERFRHEADEGAHASNDGGGASPNAAKSRLVARETDARKDMQVAEGVLEELLQLAHRWGAMLEESYQWILDAPLEQLSWAMTRLAPRLRSIAADVDAVADFEKRWSKMLDPKNLSALTPGRESGVRKWLESVPLPLPAAEIQPSPAGSTETGTKGLSAATQHPDTAEDRIQGEEGSATGLGSEDREKVTRLQQQLRARLRPNFKDWITAQDLVESAACIQLRLSEAEAEDILLHLGGGAQAAMAMYDQVFEGTLRAPEESEAEDNVGRSLLPYTWYERSMRAEFHGLGSDGKPDRLVDQESGEVVWERGSAYCRIDTLLNPSSCPELLQLFSLAASLSLPLGLTFSDDYSASEASFHMSQPPQTMAPPTSATAGQQDARGLELAMAMEDGLGGLSAVGHILLRCGWGRAGTRMPTYDEMRRLVYSAPVFADVYMVTSCTQKLGRLIRIRLLSWTMYAQVRGAKSGHGHSTSAWRIASDSL